MNAEKEIRKKNQKVFQVGDNVRIAMKELEGQVRHRIKDKRFKTIPVRFTPEIYTVVALFQPVLNNFNVDRRSYTLNDPQGNLIMEGIRPKKFYGNQLIKVPQNSNPSLIPNRIRSNQINSKINY